MSSFGRIGGNDPTVSAGGDTMPQIAGARPDLGRGTEVGRYIVIDVIGRGGMGVVYAAHDPTLDRRVALKLLHASHDADAADRLVREAQALAKLSDPHVVAVYDAGEREDQVFIAMQLVDGEDLAGALAKRDPPVETILAWFLEAGKGLVAAHEAGLVHRDFKPNNVLIDRRGRIAVTDFGLARSVAPDPERQHTQINTMIGTPAYMSPEQHGMQPATQASDQFSYCVSVWESLVGQHPFVVGPREQLSPFAIGYAIYDGELIVPAKTRAPRRVLEILKRGLARDPAQRWPSMHALLAALAPPATRRAWPYVLGALAVAGGAVAVTLALVGRGEQTDECARAATERAAVAWNPAAAATIAAKFGETKRSYAATAAKLFGDGLDKYAARWRGIAADACHTQGTEAAELRERRGACLDRRLDAVRALVSLASGEARAEFVDRATAMVDGLPDLGECGDPAALLAAPGAPPPALAARVQPLDAAVASAGERGLGGDFVGARAQLVDLAAKADAIGWGPLSARAHLGLGLVQLGMLAPARAELERAAELAYANHLDRDAARAWMNALQAAGTERAPDAVAALVPVARGAAARIGDPAVQLRAEISYGRALARMKKSDEAAVVCRAALAAAKARSDGNADVDSAQDCLIEALMPLGQFNEIEPMVAQMIADTTKRYGPDHPRIGDYLTMELAVDLRHGKLAEARAKAERVLAGRRASYPPGSFKIAEALRSVAQVDRAEGKLPEAKAAYDEALAIANQVTEPDPTILLNALHTEMGYIAQASHDHAGAVEHFEAAIAGTRKRVGKDSLELALLSLNYGQIKANDDIDAAIAMEVEARAILERLGDKRVALAGAFLAELYIRDKRWFDAKQLFEAALAGATADTEPGNLALMKYHLATCLAELHEDPARANALATEARDSFATLGPESAPTVKRITAWLAKHPAPRHR